MTVVKSSSLYLFSVFFSLSSSPSSLSFSSLSLSSLLSSSIHTDKSPHHHSFMRYPLSYFQNRLYYLYIYTSIHPQIISHIHTSNVDLELLCVETMRERRIFVMHECAIEVAVQCGSLTQLDMWKQVQRNQNDTQRRDQIRYVRRTFFFFLRHVFKRTISFF